MVEPIVLGHKLVFYFIPGAPRCHNFVAIVVFENHKSTSSIVKQYNWHYRFIYLVSNDLNSFNGDGKPNESYMKGHDPI